MDFVVIKEIDEAGRIVIPKSVREYYSISPKEKLEVVPTKEGILIRKNRVSNNEKVEEQT